MNGIAYWNGEEKQGRAVEAVEPLKYRVLFWLFVVGSVLGFLLEGCWSLVSTGQWVHHAATIWGPFCIIYGLDATAAYVLSRHLAGKALPVQFAACMLSGAAVEFFGSFFQERLFGSISWDYSQHFMNLGGRVSLQMAVVWGCLGVAFIHLLYPCLARLFQRARGRGGMFLCGAMTVFMVVNFMATSVVVGRWRERTMGVPPANPLESHIDASYDERMAYLFDNLKFVSNK